MIRTLHRLVALVAVAGTAAIGTPIAAEASPPTVTVEPYELVEVIAPGEPMIFGTNPCPFAITLHHQGTFVTTVFFDADGTPIRLLGRSKAFTETYSANGRSVSTKSVASVRIEAANDEVTVHRQGKPAAPPCFQVLGFCSPRQADSSLTRKQVWSSHSRG